MIIASSQGLRDIAGRSVIDRNARKALCSGETMQFRVSLPGGLPSWEMVRQNAVLGAKSKTDSLSSGQF